MSGHSSECVASRVGYIDRPSYKAFYERTTVQKQIRQKILGGNLVKAEAQKGSLNEIQPEQRRRRLTKQKQKQMESKILRYSRRRNKWEHALRIFVQLRLQEGFLPRQMVYLAALNACGKAGLWQTALAILQDFQARTNGQPLTPEMLQAAMKACTRGGQPQEAASLLLSEMDKGQNPGPIAVATGMAVFSKLEDWDSVVCLAEYLEAQGLESTLTARNQLLSAAVARGDYQGAINQLILLGNSGFPTNVCAIDKWQKIIPDTTR
eukprot:CAMPEP_0117753456 /NCGR_PEP_ID=MMETSP0947-20121206/12229_1 /TAXON_ID=44440 /ORGANISM="Chattonella subsalsa, Strain CCMP2191" /LENGTH=264 /DNA_ID=CAMNT_0005572327 /DNA_START=353 /DNA_END=1147 /DNA_ORIENTATION=+